MANTFDLSGMPASVNSGDISMGLSRPNNFVPWVPTVPSSPAVLTWQTMVMQYRDWWTAFTGQALRVTDPRAKMIDGQLPEMFPLHINPLRWVSTKHAAALFGEVPDDYDSMVKASFRTDDGSTNDACEKHADRINRVWFDSNGKEIQTMGGIMGQFLGGSFYKVKYDPLDRSLKHHIRVESIVPDFILPIYSSTNYHDLVECWVFYYIGTQEAKERFKLKDFNEYAGKVLYSEHWTKDHYEVKIGGAVPTMEFSAASIPESGKNPFGFVPFVYIPHPPRVGDYYGSSHATDLDGLTRELNTRMADVGDYVRDNSQSLYWVRNISKKLDVMYIDNKNQRSAINLGMRNSLTGNSGGDPEIGRLDSAEGSEIHMNYVNALLQFIDRQSHMAGVAFGEDEGSQRSGSTYQARLWTFTSHIRQERTNWTAGLRRINWMIGEMMRIKHIDGVTEEDTNLKGMIGWFSILPLDRAEQVNEVSLRMAAKAMSTRNAVTMMSNGEDVEQELQEIEREKQEETDREIELAKAKPAGGFGAPKN